MTQPTQTQRSNSFIHYLEHLVEREDRGALAALRRGLGKPVGAVAEAVRIAFQAMPQGLPPWREEDYYLVATLFALHPTKWQRADGNGPTNLGASFAHLERATRSEREADGQDRQTSPVERRFSALLNADREDLPDHLRRAIALLKSHDVPVDWTELLRDLQRWGSEDRCVQRRWARAFWSRYGKASEQPGDATSEVTQQPEE